jgi:hypothetical protein
MAVSDKEIITFLNQMPPEMKQDAIKGMEFLRRMTIDEYRAKQIEAAEALIIDIQNNPKNYSTAILKNKFPEILGDFVISVDLENRIEIIKQFIGYRSQTIYNTDGSVEQHRNATYDEYIQSERHAKHIEYIANKKTSKKKR